MFDGLDQVPWRELTYALSGEADLPVLFRTLLEAEAAAEAADELLNEFYHQGGSICSAAVEALPFLMEAAESTRVTCRGDLLEIVGRLAWTAREVAPFRVAGGWAEAWEAAVPRLIALLDDEDPHLRRASASVLEQAVTHADVVVSALRDRWHAQDRSTRLDQILIIGSLAGSLTAVTLPETLIWLRDLTSAPDEQLRFAATLAPRKAMPGRAPSIEPIMTALSGDLSAWSGSEHFYGPSAWTVRWAIDGLSGDVDAQEQLCLALLAHPEAERRQGAIHAAGNVLSVSRRPRRLLPALRDHAADPDVETQTFSLHLLAAHARPGGQDADLFADHLNDEAQAPRSPLVADVAVWGLAWSGDDRCLPGLAERIDGRRSLLAAHW